MFCTNCGTRIEEEAKFCTNCGTKNEINYQSAKPALGSFDAERGFNFQKRRIQNLNLIREKQNLTSTTLLYFILGIVIGIPVSYYFQNPLIKIEISLSQYLYHFMGYFFYTPQPMLGEFLVPVILTCLICGLLSGFIGYFTTLYFYKNTK